VFSNTENQRGVAYDVFCLGQILEEQRRISQAPKEISKSPWPSGKKQATRAISQILVLPLALWQWKKDATLRARPLLVRESEEYQAQGDVDDELFAAGTLVRALLAQKKIADAQQVIATTTPASKSTNHIARLDFSTADASVRAASGKTAVFLTQSLHAPLSPDDQCISVTVIRITRVLGRTPCR
jgi:hypothetical protein